MHVEGQGWIEQLAIKRYCVAQCMRGFRQEIRDKEIDNIMMGSR